MYKGISSVWSAHTHGLSVKCPPNPYVQRHEFSVKCPHTWVQCEVPPTIPCMVAWIQCEVPPIVSYMEAWVQCKVPPKTPWMIAWLSVKCPPQSHVWWHGISSKCSSWACVFQQLVLSCWCCFESLYNLYKLVHCWKKWVIEGGTKGFTTQTHFLSTFFFLIGVTTHSCPMFSLPWWSVVLQTKSKQTFLPFKLFVVQDVVTEIRKVTNAEVQYIIYSLSRKSWVKA